MRIAFLYLFFVACLAVITAGCKTVRSDQAINQPNTPLAEQTTVVSPPTPADPSLLDTAILSKLKESSVLIGNFEGGELTSTGSGFVVGDGKRIVTNKHVVTGEDGRPDPLKIVFRSGTDQARIVQVKPEAITVYGNLGQSHKDYYKEDIAFITIGAVVSDPLELATSPNIHETMPVWALGFPGGTKILSNRDMPSVTVHSLRIERIERSKTVLTLLQLSGSPTYGNSGGPVVDRSGRVLGVLQAKAANAPILFAIPSVRVSKMLSGKKVATQSIADLWKQPIQTNTVRPKNSATSTSSDPGPKQDYSSVLNTASLSWSDLEGLSASELTILRNEPFARRGYIFKRADLRRFFSRASWYKPRTRNLSAVQRLLTRRETQNIDLVKRYQSASGLSY